MSLRLEQNIAKVCQRIREAEKKHQRNLNSVQLIAVSKTRSAVNIRQAVAAGLTHIGENYLQEALDKKSTLEDLNITWHFIGPIQSNKTRTISEHFNWVHSVDRLKIASRLSEQRPQHLGALNLCLQVNISNESSKSGISLDALMPLAAHVARLPNVVLRGLMAIPEATTDETSQRLAFCQVHDAVKKLQQHFPTIDTLSMGMSGDMEAAIAEGSTMVRIGSDIFGSRHAAAVTP